MRISVSRESCLGEARVAASPETVKKMVNLGFEVIIESNAGKVSGMGNRGYEVAGARIANDFGSVVKGADVILKVQRPSLEELTAIPRGVILIGILSPLSDQNSLDYYAKHKINAFSLDFMPRITRAQNMDVISSQSNLAGYRAVIDAAGFFGHIFPLMMTAAGTIPPAKILILGAGVAGLQAIATARRLGAVVSAFDVRPAVKEQVESLGAKFIEVKSEEVAETSGGYAKEMTEGYKKRQSERLHGAVKASDIVITTALIPGRPAPKLITKKMVHEMKPGSVIVDLAVETGGNCELSECNKVVVKEGVTIVGYANVPSRVPADASALYARNVLNFLKLLWDDKARKIKIDLDDEIIRGTLLTNNGRIVHKAFLEKSYE